MKRKISILFALVLAVSLMLVPAVASATEYDSSLTLENKDANWQPIEDGISGTLQYNSSGSTFDFNFTAQGLTLSDYSLIYYADQPVRFTYWGGDNPGAVIATFTGVSGTISSGDMSVELDMDLPCPPDANISEINYDDTPDFYPNAHGAKIWLVPTSALTGSGVLPVIAWPPTDNWLFETDLIWYDDTDAASSVVGLGAYTSSMVAISVTPGYIYFGPVIPGDTVTGQSINVQNIGSVTVNVGVLLDPATGTVFDNLKLGDAGPPPVTWHTTDLAVNGSVVVTTQLSVPVGYQAQGEEHAMLIFEATP